MVQVHGDRAVVLGSQYLDAGATWREENVEYDFVRRDWLEENLVFELKSHPPLNSLASFRDGWFYVQDPSTLLAPCANLARSPAKQFWICAPRPAARPRSSRSG